MRKKNNKRNNKAFMRDAKQVKYKFKKHQKHPWRSVTYSKVACFKCATLIKVTLLHGCFHVFEILQLIPNRIKHHK